MTRGQNALRLLVSWPACRTRETICSRCRVNLQLRAYSSAAAAAAIDEGPQVTRPSPPPTELQAPKPMYSLRAGVILSRPPQITRDLTSFEKSYFLYQRRLNERLALSFTKYFYFRKNTPPDIDWKRKIKQRKTAARDIGVYNAFSEYAWDDELKVGAPESEPEHQMEALLKDAQLSTATTADADAAAAREEANAIQRPPPRTTEADRANDQTSLDRALQRTLHLVVQSKEGRWAFPDDAFGQKESLQLAAERILVETGGVNLNTWVVGNLPIGYGKFKTPGKLITPDGFRRLGDKIFFMKARIMAGQANLAENKYGHQDFRWLVKEEIPHFVTAQYWNEVQNMLPGR